MIARLLAGFGLVLVVVMLAGWVALLGLPWWASLYGVAFWVAMVVRWRRRSAGGEQLEPLPGQPLWSPTRERGF